MFFDDKPYPVTVQPGTGADPSTLPSSFESVLKNSWGANGFGGQFFSNFHREDQLYDHRNDTVGKLTGQRLLNPFRFDIAELNDRLTKAKTQDEISAVMDLTTSAGHQRALERLAQQYPQHAAEIRADLPVPIEAENTNRALNEKAADAASRYPYALPSGVLVIGGASVPSLLAGGASTFTDPFVALTIPFFTARVGVGLAGVAVGTAYSAMANAVGTIIEQLAIAAWMHFAGQLMI